MGRGIPTRFARIGRATIRTKGLEIEFELLYFLSGQGTLRLIRDVHQWLTIILL